MEILAKNRFGLKLRDRRQRVWKEHILDKYEPGKDAELELECLSNSSPKGQTRQLATLADGTRGSVVSTI